jgi:NADPH:quinone reductase-like Zn-dependent oxidoreductase
VPYQAPPRQRLAAAGRVAATDVTRIKPIVDKVFPFDEPIAAAEYHTSGAFMGKVVVIRL